MRDLVIAGPDGCRLAATQAGDTPSVVLLHPGVGDRRTWGSVMAHLAPSLATLAYDRPGFGDTPPATAPYAQTDHLAAVLDACAAAPVVLVGNSQGGRIAIDFALEYPQRVRGLVLIGPAISGAPYEVDEGDERLAQLDAAIEAADLAGNIEEVNRLEAELWLDGPSAAPGRVGGAQRELFLAMNGIALRAASGVEPIEPPSAWERLDRLTMPVLVMLGALDAGLINDRARELARQATRAELVELEGMAHVPALEAPGVVAGLIASFVDRLA